LLIFVFVEVGVLYCSLEIKLTLCADAIISKLKGRLGKNSKHIEATFKGNPFLSREGIS
jgi:hypothetical protein